MLVNTEDFEGYAIGASDGPIGHVRDYYFDDAVWVIRYLIVDTGNWLASRKVLISPISLGPPDKVTRLLPVSITQDQVRRSPDINTDNPVSRQHELDYFAHYGYSNYWEADSIWDHGVYPNTLLHDHEEFGSPAASLATNAHAKRDAARHQDYDSHLHSCKAVEGYHVHATDGEIGHIEGLVIDDRSWAIHYLVVNTSNWWLGHHVLVAPTWIADVSWFDSMVSVKVARQAIKDAPAYDPAKPIDRAYETRLHQHYRRPGYWQNAAVVETDILRI